MVLLIQKYLRKAYGTVYYFRLGGYVLGKP